MAPKLALPLVIAAAVKSTVVPAQTGVGSVMLKLGFGFMVMVKFIACPSQPLWVPITVMMATCCEVTLPAKKLGILVPVPEIPKPIAVLLFVQRIVSKGSAVVNVI